jgi:hypothetical protein
MQFNFDGFNRYEIPPVTLANPNFSELAMLSELYDFEMTLKYNGTSEVTFKAYPHSADGTSLPYYDLLKKNRLVHIGSGENAFGWFIINTVSEADDGSTPYKVVSCYSYDYTLNSRGLPASLDDGTYKLYDINSPEDTLLGKLFAGIPKWTIELGTATIGNKYRTFETDASETILDFLMNTVEEAYECVFVFDCENFKVKVYSREDSISTTDISLSHNNLIRDCTLEESDDSIITGLAAYGGEGLSIQAVNPLGTAMVYDYSHYMTTDWMSQGLIDGLTSWRIAVDAQMVRGTFNPSTDTPSLYYEYVLSLAYANAQLSTLKTDLSNLNTQLAVLETTRATEYPNVTSTTANAIIAKQAAIDSKKSDITAKEGEIITLTTAKNAITDSLAMSEYLTNDEITELSYFQHSDSYTNENFVTTSTMTYNERVGIQFDLYDYAKKLLGRESQPKYTLTLNAINFPFLYNYECFADQLKMGCKISVEVHESVRINPILIELKFNYNDPDSFTMTFASNFVLSKADSIADLISNQARTTGKVTGDSYIWAQPVKSGLTDEVTEFINSALDTSRNKVINSTDQTVLIDPSGILVRKADNEEADGYAKKQLQITSSGIFLTTDKWGVNTVKTAIGEITVNGVNHYGMAAELIVGNIIAGNQFTITNEAGSYIIDGDGFKAESTGNNGRIVINPSTGFYLDKKIDGEWVSQIAMDMSTGEVIIAGSLVAVDTIGGWSNSDSPNVTGTGLFKKTTSTFARLGGTNAFSAGTVNGDAETANFFVTYNGELTAKKGYISDWTIDTSGMWNGGSVTSPNLYWGSGKTSQTIGSSTNLTLAFKAGSNFGVTTGGVLYATNAVFSGATANGGTFNNITATGNITANSIAANSTITSPIISGGSISGTSITSMGACNISLASGQITFSGYSGSASIHYGVGTWGNELQINANSSSVNFGNCPYIYGDNTLSIYFPNAEVLAKNYSSIYNGSRCGGVVNTYYNLQDSFGQIVTLHVVGGLVVI